jgi:hypothetical protein
MWLLIDDVRDLNTDAIARTPEAGSACWPVAPGPACAWTMTWALNKQAWTYCTGP